MHTSPSVLNRILTLVGLSLLAAKPIGAQQTLDLAPYLMTDRAAEVSLVRSAAPANVSDSAVGAMAYMLSPELHLADANPHSMPHLMFYFDKSAPATAWGANGMKAPVIDGSIGDPSSPILALRIPVRQWSDGTPALGS